MVKHAAYMVLTSYNRDPEIILTDTIKTRQRFDTKNINFVSI